MIHKSTSEWIAIDWGTTNVRAWFMDKNYNVIDTATSDQGMNKLTTEAYEQALLALTNNWIDNKSQIKVLACGMVGAKSGWVEAQYRDCPCSPLTAEAFTRVRTEDPRLLVFIVPGIRQVHPHNDVMRGEETLIAGFLAKNSEYEGVLCLPGTHTKWVRINNDLITMFQTTMTGELFELLCKHSILRHSVKSGSWNDDTFRSSVKNAHTNPEKVATQFFSVRADTLIDGLEPAHATARIAGLLTGFELSGVSEYHECERVAVVGSTQLVDVYTSALNSIGHEASGYDAGEYAIHGLSVAYNLLDKF